MSAFVKLTSRALGTTAAHDPNRTWLKYIRGRSQWNCPYWRRDLFGPAVRRSQLIEADTGVANQGAPARVVLLNKSPELLRRSYHGCET
jgi:hypothetical protein